MMMDKANIKKAMNLFGCAIGRFRSTRYSSKGYVMALTKDLRLDRKNTKEEEEYIDWTLNNPFDPFGYSDVYIRDDYMRWYYKFERKNTIGKQDSCGVSMHRVETDFLEERRTGIKDASFMRITINDDGNRLLNKNKLDMEIYVQTNKWLNGEFQYDAAMGRRLTIKNGEIRVFNANVAMTGIDCEAIGPKDEADFLKQLQNLIENLSEAIHTKVVAGLEAEKRQLEEMLLEEERNNYSNLVLSHLGTYYTKEEYEVACNRSY